MLDNSKLKIKSNGRVKYISYKLNDYIYTLSLQSHTEYINNDNTFIEKRYVLSILVDLINTKTGDNNFYNFNNCSTIPNFHINTIKMLIDLFNGNIVIPNILENKIIGKYINLSDYL